VRDGRACSGRVAAVGRAGGGPVAGGRPRVRTADGACAAAVPDRVAAGRAGRARRRAALGRLLHRAAGQRRLPFGRARAGEVVRRRHRDEVPQVRPSAAQRRGRRRDAAARRAWTAVAAPIQGRAGVRGVRSARPRRHDRQARRRRALVGLRARPPGGGRGVLRAVGRAGLARCAAGGRGPGRGAAGPARRVRRGRPSGRRGGRGGGPGSGTGRRPVRPDAVHAPRAPRRRRARPPGSRADLGRGHRRRARAGRDRLGRRAGRRAGGPHAAEGQTRLPSSGQ
jgi:hypothetical protein